MLKAVAVILPVLLPVMLCYIWADPYKVLRKYEGPDYFPDLEACPVRLGANKGLVTLNNLEHQEVMEHTYNAFIFGSSVSCYYDAFTWAALADSTGDAHPYHMDSASETLMSMADKVDYLNRTGHAIDYALVVLDPIIMAGAPDNSPPVIAPPQLHKSWFETLKYHYTFFRAATNADFLKSWIPAAIYGHPFANGRNHVFEPQPIVYNPLINQESLPQWDSLITADPSVFYASHPLPPVPVKSTASPSVLSGERLHALRSIADTFRRHHTDYHIIIAPNRLKVTLNPEDLRTLNELFGSASVHDFSTIFVDALAADTLLYDKTHYRPVFAKRLMEYTYGASDSTSCVNSNGL